MRSLLKEEDLLSEFEVADNELSTADLGLAHLDILTVKSYAINLVVNATVLYIVI